MTTSIEDTGELPFKLREAPPVGALERRVLDVLWKTRQAHTTRGMVQELTAPGGQKPAYTTVATVLGHLVDKALAERELIGGVWSYRATLTGCQFSAAHMVRTLGETNDRRRCLTRFAGMLDPQDAAFLKSLL
ncbi:BlaI/MecI/CopY family transcriptional regulator [Paeniglutamicibacter sulfureus]|uniref:Transcriptional regulator n=1 Tax=Paeniglutamicibacter sulfureus TaxID=43666 RepID=A0ABU2BJM4_9MICC|nr:BlaI/MecI/CopY family transcriptional regulator [Paeniglutamicibacter sulfureus]MDR7358850.1 putative transcriptional regulator [Paeniglutamicibacter sulfureus]